MAKNEVYPVCHVTDKLYCMVIRIIPILIF